MDKKEDPKKAASDDDDEESEEEVPQEVIDQGLLDACRENNMEEVHTYLEKANPLYTKDGWNALLWAANNGNDQLIRLLHKKGATSMYMKGGVQVQDEDGEDQKAADDAEEEDPFQKPQDARKHGKYTPLHWASYKGHK